MSILCKGQLRRSVFAAQLLSNWTSERINSGFHTVTRHHIDKTPYSYFCIKGWPLYPWRNFHLTPHSRLRTLFSEDQQKKITNFINEVEPDKKLRVSKLRCLNKVIASLPENGPLQNINDLLEKYSLSSSNAITACYAILETLDKAEKENIRKASSKKTTVSRKVNNLIRSITPKVCNPELIKKFAAIVITEGFISFARLEGHGTQNLWHSQKLSSWAACELPKDMPFPEVIEKLWEFLPADDINVLYIIPSRQANLQTIGQLYGATVSLLCAKNDFKKEVLKRIFHVSGRAPAREFNFVIGNEIVSSINIVDNIIEKVEGSSIDHVYFRSLQEVSFDVSAQICYKNSHDDIRELLCQSLMLAKTFVELLR